MIKYGFEIRHVDVSHGSLSDWQIMGDRLGYATPSEAALALSIYLEVGIRQSWALEGRLIKIYLPNLPDESA